MEIKCPQCNGEGSYWKVSSMDNLFQEKVDCHNCKRTGFIEKVENKIQELQKQKTFKVITLCGSTKFKQQFEEVNARLTMEGNIVISVGVFSHANKVELTNRQKEQLDKIHKQKIDMSDEIFVVNVGGYIGDGLKDEIKYAKLHGIPVKYLEEI